MRSLRNRFTLPLVFLAALSFAAAALTQSPPTAPASRWYKGNLHTHTLNSDGDSTPHEVATWYREHGYQFLALTDHNHFTDPASGLNALHAAREKFLLLPGEEVTDSFEKKPIHINGINIEREVKPRAGASVTATIQNDVDAIREAGGEPSLNHPNFHWAISARDLLGVNNLRLFEVFNGHPTVNNAGGGGFQSLDEMWDTLLSAGRRIHGVAVDDAHHFKRIGKEFSNPGRGWVVVRAPALTAREIGEALRRGDFYASSGVVLKDVAASPATGEYRIEIDQRSTEKFTTCFIGEGGQVLARSFDAKPVYRLAAAAAGGASKYVRARVESSFGVTAWTQPMFRE